MKTYKFISRLLDKITQSPTNHEFDYYNHKVVLQSGTPGFVDAVVYNTRDRYSGSMLEFDFDYWTKHLHIRHSESGRLSERVIKTFKEFYGRHIRIFREDD